MFLLAASFANAQPIGLDSPGSRFEGRVIAHIDFSPEEQPLPREELDRALPIHVGDRLDMAAVRDAIQKLYDIGRFSDISVDATEEADGLRLTFATELSYFVSRVNIRGEQEPPNRNQLSTAARLELGTAFHQDNLDTANARMQERLRANGFYKAEIESRVDFRDDTEEASIYFEVKPGGRAHYGGVALLNSEGLSASEQSAIIRATDWHRGIAFIPLPGWRAVTESRTQEGLRNVRQRLRRKNDRLLARVTLEREEFNAEKNRVIPVLSIDPGPTIEVRTAGAKIRKGKLQDLLPIYQEGTVDRSLLLEGQRNVTEYLRSQGYFNAAVDYMESQPSPDRTVIEYQIDRGEKHKLHTIVISGNMYFDQTTLRERMFIQPAGKLRYRSGRYSPRMLDQDMNAIRALYQSNGFRDVDVTADVQEDPFRPSDIAVRIQILEGRQWFVNTLTIMGLSAADETYLRSQLRSSEGQPFSPANVAADRDTILTYFYNGGYADASFSWAQASAGEEGFVDLRFTVQPGEVQYVRDILVRGLDTTKPSLIASRILLKPGDPLSLSQIGQSQQRLYDLGVFAKVQTATQNPEGKEESKRVLFFLDEARKYSINAGVGAEMGRIGGGTSSVAYPAGNTGFAPRVSLGISRINFLGIGHTASLQTLISTQQKRGLLNYLAPQFIGNPDLSLTMSALFSDALDIRTFGSRRWEGSVQLARRLTRSNTVQGRVTFRRVTINSLKVAPELIPLLSRPVRIGQGGGTFIRDRRDDPVDSHRGSYNSLDSSFALALSSVPIPRESRDASVRTYFSRSLFRNSTYHPFKRDVVLARSLQFGYIGVTSGTPLIPEADQIPIAERFFAGGSSSHRGFPENQAGPRDALTGFPIGGSAMLFHSTELRFPLIGDNLGGVVFHDMGNVYTDIERLSFRIHQKYSEAENIYDFNYMVHAVGGGIRYRTPVGPLRIDLAYAPNSPRFYGFKGTLDDVDNLKPNEPLCPNVTNPALCGQQRINRFQFHFSLGQTF